MDLTHKVDQLLGQMRAAQSMAAKIGAKLGNEAPEEANRLRGHSVAATGLAMEAVEIADGFPAGCAFDR